MERLIVIDEDRSLDFGGLDMVAFRKRVEDMLRTRGDRLWVILELQRELDEFIDAVRGVSRDDKLLWVRRNALAGLMEVAEFIDGLNWKWWVNPGNVDRRYLAEELADVLHFLASAINVSGLVVRDVVQSGGDGLSALFEEEAKTLEEMGYAGGLDEGLALDLSVKLINTLSGLYSEPSLYKSGLTTALRLLVGVAVATSITADELFDAYVVKNLKNRLRQLSKAFRGGKYYAGGVSVVRNS